jgi:translocation and assembly module TamB
VSLADHISISQPSHSALPDHVHGLDTLQRPPRTLKRSIALGQPNSLFHRPVVLFNHVIEILALANLASSSIHGRGTAQLTGNYPLTAQLTFDHVAWTRIQALLGSGGSEPPSFEASAAGQIAISGPAMRTGDMSGSLQLTRVQLNTKPQEGSAAKSVVIENQGPITATLDRGEARLENLHLIGPQTDFRAIGIVSLQAQTVDATVNANTNLGVLQQFNRDVVSSGEIVLATAVRGTMAKPVINGRLELHNASFNHTEIPNGITNTNGVVLFNGNNASVQRLIAELGGGKLTVGGFVAYNELVRFGLRANAANVRIRLQEGVSAVADANIQITGGTQASVVSGTVTIEQVTYAPTGDFGSILSRSAPTV